MNNFKIWKKIEIWTIFKFEKNSKYEQFSNLNKIRNMNNFQIWTKFEIWTIFKFEQKRKNEKTKIEKRKENRKEKKKRKKKNKDYYGKKSKQTNMRQAQIRPLRVQWGYAARGDKRR
jgi:hypothetical protein